MRTMQSHPKQQLRRQIRFFFHRWHRRIGLLAAALVVLLSVTGVALNHTGSLNLDRMFPQSSLILWPYASVIPKANEVQTSEGRLHSQNGQLTLNSERLAPCDRLKGYAENASFALVACGDSWHLFTADFLLIESFDPILAGIEQRYLPGTAGTSLAVGDGQDWVIFDPDTLTLTAPATGAQSGRLTEVVAENRAISWQRVILDLHSGRWFGDWGVWMMDAAAIILLLLSFSGIWMWWARPRRRR